MKDKEVKKKSEAKAGEFWSINTKRVVGHKGLITKRKKNGDLDAVITTHAQITRKQKNIKLNENPDKKDPRDAYILRKKEKANIKSLGKYHPDMKITDKRDKSLIRKVKKRRG